MGMLRIHVSFQKVRVKLSSWVENPQVYGAPLINMGVRVPRLIEKIRIQKMKSGLLPHQGYSVSLIISLGDFMKLLVWATRIFSSKTCLFPKASSAFWIRSLTSVGFIK